MCPITQTYPSLLLPSKYHRRKSVDEAGSSAAGLAKPAATKYHGREPVVVYLTFGI